jgi:hypothetical protein
MGNENLDEFWAQNKQAIGRTLPHGVDALAQVLQASAKSFGLIQQVEGASVQWLTKEGKIALLFCTVPDPRDLSHILDIYIYVEEHQPSLTAIFVHRWTDGENNWDVFVITPRRAMQHADRICGSKTIKERGPQLREDLYTLFTCDREFPEPGRAGWAKLLAGPVEGVHDELCTLAAQHGCKQTIKDKTVQWMNSEGKMEVAFFVLPEPADIEAVIHIYEQIRQNQYPISFVFVKCDRPGLFDIFRLSARSYLEHHNQAKAWADKKIVSGVAGTPVKQLENLRWVPRWVSHVGCIKGCLNYLGIDVSDAWLYGATGHAFVLNISPGLCPSGPTDWDTQQFLNLGRNIGYLVECVDEYCPKQNSDLRNAQERAWKHIRHAIDKELPCYGWELDIPEYFVIYGYDETGYYISGPECDEGKGPIPRQYLGRSKIGVVLVSSVRPTAPADARKTVCDALTYALDIGHNRCKWTDRTGGLKGYDKWIHDIEAGIADRFGLGYNAAVWAECRRYAVEFLKQARERLDNDLKPLFTAALGHYDTIAQKLKGVSDTYPFKEYDGERTQVDEHSRKVVEMLKHARDAEVAGLNILGELISRLK